MNLKKEIHNIQPVWNKESKILILGSFPSVLSREQEFFYGHPQNRFWKVLAGILNEAIPTTIEQKKEFLLKNHIAVWDVIGSCEIEGSKDHTIQNVVPNPIQDILYQTNIQKIYLNGKTAEKYYLKYIYPTLLYEAIPLPSTSPANAKFNVNMLIDKWKIILNALL